MRKSSITPGAFIAFLILFVSASIVKAQLPQRTISIAGLIVNAQTLSPIEAAQLFDANGSKLGVTDKNGYYKIDLNILRDGEIYFKLKIVKHGYEEMTQTEHWGNLGDTKSMMYFGLKASKSDAEPFSVLAPGNKHGLDYNSIAKGFDMVRSERGFYSQLRKAKEGNQDVFVQIDGKFYIIDDGGWIQLSTDKDLVSIDNKQVVSADKLNGIIKRKNVKGMTPMDSQDAKFLIHTQ